MSASEPDPSLPCGTGGRRDASAPAAISTRRISSRSPASSRRFASWFIRTLPTILRIMRRVWPIARVPFTGLTFVTRYDDVQEVLAQDEAFPVPFGKKVQELNDGPNFVLGMPAGPEYWLISAPGHANLPPRRYCGHRHPDGRAHGKEIVDDSNGRLDAIEGLITLVATRICEDYYGIRLQPEQRVPFSQWTFAMSMYMFADPFDDPRLKPQALAGGRAVRASRRCVDRRRPGRAGGRRYRAAPAA